MNPKPNDQWRYTPPKVTQRGDVWVDAMQLPMVLELYARMKVDPNVKPNPPRSCR